MAGRYIQLTLLIAGLVLLSALVQASSGITTDPALMLESDAPNQLESYLALGLPVPLKCADESVLGLIPGLGAVRAQLLFQRSSELVSAAAVYPPPLRYKVLTVLHGIGEVSAKKLAPYLSFEDLPCDPIFRELE